MKLVIINTLYAPTAIGGAERSVQVLAETLVYLKHNVTVICTRAEKGAKQAWVNGVKVYYLGLKNSYWPHDQNAVSAPTKLFWHLRDSYNPAMGREVGRILDLEQPDLVHTNNLSGFSVSVWREVKRRNLPLVHSLRDYYLLCPKATMYKRGNCQGQCPDCKLLSLPKAAQTTLIDSVVGISDFILKRHLDFGYFVSALQNVVPNAYQVMTLAVHLPSDKVRFGFLGRLAPVKGLDLLLKACKALNQQGSFELLVGGVGDEHYLAYLRRRYPLANCTYLGHVDPAQFFASIDVLVVPSLWHEPMGRIVIEAFAHGVPVIGTNRGGIPRLIDKETGFIFDPNEQQTLQGILEHFLQNPRLASRMQKACLTKARSFLPLPTTKAYLEVYQSLL